MPIGVIIPDNSFVYDPITMRDIETCVPLVTRLQPDSLVGHIALFQHRNCRGGDTNAVERML